MKDLVIYEFIRQYICLQDDLLYFEKRYFQSLIFQLQTESAGLLINYQIPDL